MLSGYSDVVAAFHDPRLSSERAEPLRALAACPELNPFFDYLAGRMDFRDPPAHARLRGLVSQVFTPHAVAALRPRIEELVEQFLDRVEGQGRMDVIADLAFPLPGTVIAELLGVPVEDRQRLKDWSDTFVGFFKTAPSETTAEEYRRSHQAAKELGAYYRGVLHRHPEGGTGLLEAMARAELAGDQSHGGRAFGQRHPALARRARDHHSPDRQRPACAFCAIPTKFAPWWTSQD